MRKISLALLFVLFCTVTAIADDTTYVITIKNITPYNKVIMIYNDSKEITHQIGLAPPQTSIKIKPQETKSVELKAGNYSIIEKTPAYNHYKCYNIIVPEDLASKQIIELLKKGITL
jgi:cytochrome c oxidase assembly protein Cox11